MQPQSPEFAELLATCLQRIEAEGMSALSDICAAHPEAAEALKAAVSRLGEVGMLQAAGSEAVDAVPERLGDFRLLRRLGVGGMGVVYQAEQLSLGRVVALKLIRPEFLYFPGARARLRREVDSVARLDHPHIVSVYAVGRDATGRDAAVPHFAMEYVSGCSLADLCEALRGSEPARLQGAQVHRLICAAAARSGARTPDEELPDLYRGSWASVCVRIFRRVAEALEHAHGRGIVHRDVKPSNIMLSTVGRVLVVDFGLAKLQAAPKLTRSGSMLGSMAYMAPEQLRGEAIGARSDVYSLGVSLYEALCLQLPFTASTGPELQAAILAGICPRPRSLNPSIDRDLETVCLSAMHPEQHRRYASARELADDLVAVAERRPVSARRIGLLARSWRWVQRHRALSVALVLATGTPLALWLQDRGARREVEQALVEAEQNFGDALRAVDRLLGRVATNALRHQPQLARLRHQLLGDAAEFYAAFVRKHPGDPRLLRRALVVHGERAHLGIQLKLSEQAFADYGRCDALFAALPDPTPADVLRYLRFAQNHVAACLDVPERHAVGLAMHTRMMGVAAELARHPELDEEQAFRLRVARALQLHLRGMMRQAGESSSAGIQDLRDARGMLELELAARPADPVLCAEFGKLSRCLAEIQEQNGQPEAAAAMYARAVEALAVPFGMDRRRPGIGQLLVETRCLAARNALGRGELAAAQKLSEAAVVEAAELARNYPDFWLIAYWYAMAAHSLSLCHYEARDYRAALLAAGTALKAQGRSQQLNPSSKTGDALWKHGYQRCRVLCRLGRTATVRQMAARMAQSREQPVYQYRAAELSAFAAMCLPRSDPKREVYAKAAEQHMRAALDGGLKGQGLLQSEGLDALRGRPGMQALAARLAGSR